MELIWLILIPLFAALLLLALPQVRTIAFLLSLIPLVLLVSGKLIDTASYSWFSPLSINFALKLDAISWIFLLLTSIIIPISIAVSDRDYPNSFFALILLTQTLLNGFFLANDLVVFLIFWEAMLLPIFFIISVWGGEKRKKAALQFLLYMIAGSALMIAGVLAVYFTAKTFDLTQLSAIKYAPWIALVFLLAFAVKTPLFPFHAWLAEAYTEAPLAGTIILSGLLSKAGIYGIVRIAYPLFNDWMIVFAPYLIALAVIGVFYGALLAWSENDYKRLIAYSSFSHVNFILVGLFIAIEPSLTGSTLQAFNHGVTITALFIVAYWLEERLGSREIGPVKGMMKFLPRLGWLTLFFVLSSVALPGTNSFIGELLILLGAIKYNFWLAAILVLSVILSVVYMLRFMQKVYFEEPTFFRDRWIDIGLKEYLVVIPLIFLVLWVGLYPAPLIKQLESVFVTWKAPVV